MLIWEEVFFVNTRNEKQKLYLRCELLVDKCLQATSNNRTCYWVAGDLLYKYIYGEYSVNISGGYNTAPYRVDITNF